LSSLRAGAAGFKITGVEPAVVFTGDAGGAAGVTGAAIIRGGGFASCAGKGSSLRASPFPLRTAGGTSECRGFCFRLIDEEDARIYNDLPFFNWHNFLVPMKQPPTWSRRGNNGPLGVKLEMQRQMQRLGFLRNPLHVQQNDSFDPN
jgi:hypothetical protein